MKSTKYDILQAAQQIAAGKTTYRKLVEVKELVDVESYFIPFQVLR